jgi:hypothetical protein
MKWLRTFFVLLVLCTTLFAADWPSTGGNAQRDGWSRGEKKLSRETAASIRFLYDFKVNHDLTSPAVLSNLITYKGFKQLVFFGENSGSVAAIDADLGTLFFDTPLTTETTKARSAGTATCPGGMTASVAFAGNSLAPGRFGSAAVNHVGRVSRNKTIPSPRITMSAPVYAVSQDGLLHSILQLSGIATTVAPLKFLPPMARATGLNINAERIFLATVGNCGGNANQIYSIDPSGGAVASFPTGGSGASGSGGTAIGTDGVVYAQIASGHGEGTGDYNDSVVALSPDQLKMQDYFTPEGGPAKVDAADLSGVTPAVFGLLDKDWIVSGGHDGRIYILDADSLGGADHHTPAFRSDPILPPNSPGNGFWNNFATYLDAKGERWLYASVHGPVSAKFPGTNGDAPTGSILAFKITFDNGKPSLTPAWRSPDMVSPAAPAVSNDLVMALSTGQPASYVKANGKPYKAGQWSKLGRPAVLYVLDAETGKPLYTGNKATTYATSGLAIANSQIYFATHEDGLYAYGIPIER